MNIEMKRCEKCGSFFNAAKTPSCPYCSDKTENIDKTMPTVASVDAMVTSREVTVPTPEVTEMPKTEAMPVEETKSKAVLMEDVISEDNKTRVASYVRASVDPVVGWLVCVAGKDKGRDYKIHADNNHIGRDESMDICIRGDETISRENHATITYDGMEKVFYFAPGAGRSIVRLNGKALLMTAELKQYDRITLGETELMFIPLCGSEFDW